MPVGGCVGEYSPRNREDGLRFINAGFKLQIDTCKTPQADNLQLCAIQLPA